MAVFLRNLDIQFKYKSYHGSGLEWATTEEPVVTAAGGRKRAHSGPHTS